MANARIALLVILLLVPAGASVAATTTVKGSPQELAGLHRYVIWVANNEAGLRNIIAHEVQKQLPHLTLMSSERNPQKPAEVIILIFGGGGPQLRVWSDPHGMAALPANVGRVARLADDQLRVLAEFPMRPDWTPEVGAGELAHDFAKLYRKLNPSWAQMQGLPMEALEPASKQGTTTAKKLSELETVLGDERELGVTTRFMLTISDPEFRAGFEEVMLQKLPKLHEVAGADFLSPETAFIGVRPRDAGDRRVLVELFRVVGNQKRVLDTWRLDPNGARTVGREAARRFAGSYQHLSRPE